MSADVFEVEERVEGRDEAEGEPEGVPARPPRPDLCRRFARKELAAGLPIILRRFIGEAKGGSIPHMKVLVELAGLDKDGAAKPLARRRSKKARSLSEFLLAELRRGLPAEQERSEKAP